VTGVQTCALPILTKRFDGGVEAVTDLNLEVAQGEIFAFLGPNGAGKTTTIRMLTTLLKPTSGAARVVDVDVVTKGDRVRRLIGVALQEAGLDPLMTATELMELQAALHDLPWTKDLAARVRSLLDDVGLSDDAGRQVGTYSAGMRRRLDLAMALLHRPRVLFLDEPTTGLDPVSRKTIWKRVRELRDAGTTIFLTTHYLEEADHLADRLMIIDGGRTVAEGTPEQLKALHGRSRLEVTAASGSDKVRDVVGRFGEVLPGSNGTVSVSLHSGATELASIIRAIDEEGVVIASFDLQAPTLDDVFIAKTGRRLQPAMNGSSSQVGSEGER
jgi:ABC-2 type transport system ATP-binding protein